MKDTDKRELEYIIRQSKVVGIALAVVIFCLFILFLAKY